MFELVEEFLRDTVDATPWDARRRSMRRSCFVVFTAAVAWLIPMFSVFISLVGATASAALAFVLPAVTEALRAECSVLEGESFRTVRIE